MRLVVCNIVSPAAAADLGDPAAAAAAAAAAASVNSPLLLSAEGWLLAAAVLGLPLLLLGPLLEALARLDPAGDTAAAAVNVGAML